MACFKFCDIKHQYEQMSNGISLMRSTKLQISQRLRPPSSTSGALLRAAFQAFSLSLTEIEKLINLVV